MSLKSLRLIYACFDYNSLKNRRAKLVASSLKCLIKIYGTKTRGYTIPNPSVPSLIARSSAFSNCSYES